MMNATIINAIANRQFDIVRELIEQPINKSWDSPSWKVSYFIIKYLVDNNGPFDILKSMIDKLTDDKQETLNKLILMPRISDDVILVLLNAGVDPNTMYYDEPILIRLLANCRPRHTIKLLLDHGANPNLPTTFGDYAIDICERKIELLLLRYGANKYDNGIRARHITMMLRVLIVCDMMLYMDDSVQLEWKIAIKGYLY